MMSATMIYHSRSIKDAQKVGLNWAKNVSCTMTANNKEYPDIGCLRNLDPKKIINAQGGNLDSTEYPPQEIAWFYPHTDGKIIPNDVFKMLESGKFKKVPVLIGWMRDELGAITFNLDIRKRFKPDEKMFEYEAATNTVKYMTGKKSPLVLQKYPFSQTDVKHNADQLIGIASQFFFKCSAYYMMKKWRQKGFKVHAYEFRKIQKFIKLGRCHKDLACHAFELHYLWRPIWFRINAKERKFSDDFIKRIIGFISDKLSPSTWPSYSKSGKIMIMDDGFKATSSAYMDKMCDFWHKQVGYEYP